MSNKVVYETEYKKTGHFSFGKNWQSFLTTLTPERMKIAEQSLETFLGGKNCLKGKSFIDIGSGSGIFSLAALRLKASRVMSVDIDESSVACARYLKKEEGSPATWQIKTASALDSHAIDKLGRFDVVYSWGVLHHTGDMYAAIKNVSVLVRPKGQFFIAIYNDYRGLIHGKSTFWKKFKQHYNRSPKPVKHIYEGLYASYLWIGLALHGHNPASYIRNYQSARGMSWWHDILDWLGGDPYEYAAPEEIVGYIEKLGFTLQKLHVVNTIGCNEYVFVRNGESKDLPKVTVLLSVHNAATTLAKTFASLAEQTVVPAIVCVNDASTDNTADIIREWKKKLGKRLTVINNAKNLGLTKSLNKGLHQITTPYTARIDADDWWEPSKLEKQLNFFHINPTYGVVGCWYANYGRSRVTHLAPPMRDEVIRQRLIYQNTFAHSCVMFNTQLIRRLGGYDSKVRYGQDYELWMRCLPKTKFFNLPEELCYRSFIGGISIERQRDQMYYALQTRLKYIRQYRLPFATYGALVEPWLVWVTPRWVTNLKRRLLS